MKKRKPGARSSRSSLGRPKPGKNGSPDAAATDSAADAWLRQVEELQERLRGGQPAKPQEVTAGSRKAPAGS